jgi:periplasmic copper chaperone A
MKTPLFKHAIVTAAASVAVILITGGIASAHVETDPIAMQVGTTATVAFNVEHGCDGSPMTDLKIQIPPGVTGVAAVDKAGWTATVTGDTVEFTGGSLDATTEDHFDLTLTAPTTPGKINFPAIEKCQVGEIDWIEIAAQGAPEPEDPAPSLLITQNPPTAAELTPVPDEEDSAGTTVAGGTLVTTDVGGTTAASGTLVPTDVGSTAVPLGTPGTTPPKKDSSDKGAIVVVVIVVAALAVGGGVLMTRRRGGSAPKA